MTCWNKIAPVSSYLDDVLSGTDKGSVRVCVPRFVDSLQIMTVVVSFNESFWLAIGVATSTTFSVLFCGMVRCFEPSELMIIACKLVLREVMLSIILAFVFFIKL